MALSLAFLLSPHQQTVMVPYSNYIWNLISSPSPLPPPGSSHQPLFSGWLQCLCSELLSLPLLFSICTAPREMQLKYKPDCDAQSVSVALVFRESQSPSGHFSHQAHLLPA